MTPMQCLWCESISAGYHDSDGAFLWNTYLPVEFVVASLVSRGKMYLKWINLVLMKGFNM